MHRRLNFLFVVVAATVLATALSPRSPVIREPSAPLALTRSATLPLHFVVFGDTRFTDPADTKPANSAVRQAMVRAIARETPAFVSITGDIVYNGYNPDDWKVWDSETSAWHNAKIPIYPALGNHDLKGNEATALGNYFARFPELQQHRYYSVRIANCLLLVLDSALDETSGPQGDWIQQNLDQLPPSVKFVFFIMHHPPYTSSDDKNPGGGHSVRPGERAFAAMLEQRQESTSARLVVFGGHVHNYERFEHGGVTYFVTGGGGAKPYLVTRRPQDGFQGAGVNYHYLLVEVTENAMTVTMHRLDLTTGRENWSEPDKVSVAASTASAKH